MAGQGVNGLAVAATGAGVLLVWSGVKGASVTGSLRSLLSGHQPSGAPTAAATAATAGAGGSGGPAAPANVSGNTALARLLAATYGWGTGSEWNALYNLWTRESGFNNRAQNPSSGAYGIPQALPYTKMPRAAWPPSAGGSASASAQINWGLAYIRERYGRPTAAWAHENSAGWY